MFFLWLDRDCILLTFCLFPTKKVNLYIFGTFVLNQIELLATLPVLEQKSTATSEQERISTLN